MALLTVEFEIHDPDRFEPLLVVFEALREAKTADSFTEDHSGWLVYFDDAARSYFRWSTPEEDAQWLQRWHSTPVPQRWSDPTLNRGWDLESMIEAFRNGEYDLLACRRPTDSTGRLTFFAHAFPFGGSGCMRGLIECFGHRVTKDYDHDWKSS